MAPRTRPKTGYPASRTRTSIGAERTRDELLWYFESKLDKTATRPDIIEFAMSDAYLDRPLYPIQGTMLKIWALQDELFTQFDHDQIGLWTDSFLRTGDCGVQPDIYERIRQNKEDGRPWFKEWINVLGRRASKGWIGAIADAYVLWSMILKGDPQGYYGVARDKRLAMLVFASKKELAVKNLWGDIYNCLLGSNCFIPYLPRKTLKENLLVFTPNDYARIHDRRAKGLEVSPEDMASIEITPKESTVMASRGPAVFCLNFDEFAWITRQTSKADSTELWTSATPATETFKKDAFIYEASSPWQMLGQFYENSRQALAISDGTMGFPEGMILRPELLMFQLESWRTYEHWERAHEIPTRPEAKKILHGPHGAFYPRMRQAQMESPDVNMESKAKEIANPEGFRVEFRAKWAMVMDAYLNPDNVDRMFAPWPEKAPVNDSMKSFGFPNVDYYAHCDPSKVGKNTGFAIAHVVNVPGSPLPHVVFDVIRHWEPGQFEQNNWEIDYEVLIEEFKVYIKQFMPNEFTFDQGYSAWMIQQLSKWVHANRLPKAVNVYEKTATFARNWEVAEVFKVALNLGCVHAPHYPLLEQELKFLQVTGDRKVDHPTVGDVQTKDIYDAVSQTVHGLIGKRVAAMLGQELMSVGVRPALAGGLPMPPVAPGPQKAPVNQVAAQMMAFTNRQGGAFGRSMPPPSRGGRFYPTRGRP